MWFAVIGAVLTVAAIRGPRFGGTFYSGGRLGVKGQADHSLYGRVATGVSCDRSKWRHLVLARYRYRNIYTTDVIDSRLLARHGDTFRVFLRLREKQIVTVVFNTEYDIAYAQPDAMHMTIRSRSTRIAEVHDPDRSMTVEEPVGEDDGFLWRIDSYWRFEEADGGLYVECRAVSLSRGLPFGFGWLRGFIQQFPKESMMNTLNATKHAIASRTAG